MKLITLALLVGLVLAGCGSDKKADTTQDAQASIRQVFNEYNAALAKRDFKTSCGYLAPETTDKLRTNVEKLGYKNPPKKCADLLQLVYKVIDSQPDQKNLVATILKTAKVDSVDVTGDAGVVNWHATVKGKTTPVTQSVRLVDGEWKLIDVTN